MTDNPYESPSRTAAEVRSSSPGADALPSTFTWWESRRLRYNVGLVCAGMLAFLCYVVVCLTLLPRVLDASQIDVTPLTTLVQGIGYLFMMGIANLRYFLGARCERIIRPRNIGRYRRISYGLGFWFSVLLPFGIPAWLTVEILFFPGAFGQRLSCKRWGAGVTDIIVDVEAEGPIPGDYSMVCFGGKKTGQVRYPQRKPAGMKAQ
jgi:hypothetical protein